MTREAASFSRIEHQASGWLVAMGDRTVSLSERARFEAWLAADPEHERVYRIQEAAWRAVAQMQHLRAQVDVSDSSWRGTRRPLVGYAALAASLLLAIVAGALFLAQRQGWVDFGRAYETATAQIKDFELEDGTRVTLGASSRIQVDFGESRRNVRLTRGEAFFEVTRDTSRPFIVSAGDTLVRVLGTKFDVHYGPKAIRVAVLEGRVQVTQERGAAGGTSSAPQVLTAGESVSADLQGDSISTTAVSTANLGAWRQGRLVYVDARLRDVIADLNRYYGGRIELEDDSVGDMQLTAAFRTDQIDRMLEVLEEALPVRARRPGEKQILLTRR